MSEISREEAILFLKRYDEDVYTDKCRQSHNMAISDMQKLEKIEQIIQKSTFHPNSWQASVELLKVIHKIGDIIRGGKNEID